MSGKEGKDSKQSNPAGKKSVVQTKNQTPSNQHDLGAESAPPTQENLARNHEPVRANQILRLQKTVGNRHVSNRLGHPFAGSTSAVAFPTVQREMEVSEEGDKLEEEAETVAETVMRQGLMGAAGDTPNEEDELTIQTKMQVNEPNDQYEQEADAVASQVMRMGEDEEEIQRQPISTSIQRSGASTPEVAPEIEQGVQGLQSGGSPLPEGERQFFESRMGADFSEVRIHNDSKSTDLSNNLEARAFTVGNSIAFNEGEYRPGSAAGRELLAHELTHVVQQGAAPQVNEQETSVVQRQPTAIQRQEQLSVSAPATNPPPISTTPLPQNNQPITTAPPPAPLNLSQPTSTNIGPVAPVQTNSSATIAPITQPTSPALTPVHPPPPTTSGAGSTPVANLTETGQALQQFVEQSNLKKQDAVMAGDTLKQDLLSRGESQKVTAQQQLEAELTRLQENYQLACEQIQQTTQTQKAKINDKQLTVVQNIQNYATAEKQNLLQTLTTQQEAVKAAAEEKAISATNAGEEEAQRALTASTEKSNNARNLAAGVAGDIQGEAQQIADEAANKITESGNNIASTARQDAEALANKFRQEGQEAANSFVELYNKGLEHIDQICSDSTTQANNLVTENLAQIDTAEQEALLKLQEAYQTSTQQLQELLPQTLNTIDEITQNAITQVDENNQKITTFIDQELSGLSEEIGIYPDELILENISAAGLEIDNALNAHSSALNDLDSQFDGSIQKISNTGTQDGQNQVEQLSIEFQNINNDYLLCFSLSESTLKNEK